MFLKPGFQILCQGLPSKIVVDFVVGTRVNFQSFILELNFVEKLPSSFGIADLVIFTMHDQ